MLTPSSSTTSTQPLTDANATTVKEEAQVCEDDGANLTPTPTEFQQQQQQEDVPMSSVTDPAADAVPVAARVEEKDGTGTGTLPNVKALNDDMLNRHLQLLMEEKRARDSVASVAGNGTVTGDLNLNGNGSGNVKAEPSENVPSVVGTAPVVAPAIAGQELSKNLYEAGSGEFTAGQLFNAYMSTTGAAHYPTPMVHHPQAQTSTPFQNGNIPMHSIHPHSQNMFTAIAPIYHHPSSLVNHNPMGGAGNAVDSSLLLPKPSGGKPFRKPLPPGLTASNRTRRFVNHDYIDFCMVEPTPHEANMDMYYETKQVGSDIIKIFDPSQRLPFPLKFHIALSAIADAGLNEIICWQPHGRAILIGKPKLFETKVVEKYFYMRKLTSFQRQLNLYGFRRITCGPDAGAYYHPLFLKGKPGLSRRMQRTKVKGSGFKAAARPEAEPDFYQMIPCLDKSIHDKVAKIVSSFDIDVAKKPLGDDNPPAKEEKPKKRKQDSAAAAAALLSFTDGSQQNSAEAENSEV